MQASSHRSGQSTICRQYEYVNGAAAAQPTLHLGCLAPLQKARQVGNAPGCWRGEAQSGELLQGEASWPSLAAWDVELKPQMRAKAWHYYGPYP